VRSLANLRLPCEAGECAYGFESTSAEETVWRKRPCYCVRACVCACACVRAFVPMSLCVIFFTYISRIVYFFSGKFLCTIDTVRTINQMSGSNTHVKSRRMSARRRTSRASRRRTPELLLSQSCGKDTDIGYRLLGHKYILFSKRNTKNTGLFFSK